MSLRVSHGTSDTQDVHNIRRAQERRSGVSARAPSGAVRFPPCRRPITRRHRRLPPPEPGCPCQKNSNTKENLSRHRVSPLVSSDSRKYIFYIASMYSPDR